MSRSVLFVVHAGRPNTLDVARAAARGLLAAGISVACFADEAEALDLPGLTQAETAQGCELIVVFGGDGTILRAVESAMPHDVPVLGVNLGHVGFLAEAEPENIDAVVTAIINGELVVEQRVALNVTATNADGYMWSSWSLNEVAIEKHQRERMIDVMVSIDGQPLSRWSCDGVMCATPTGSTAYAFSAGGPVVWPEVNAFLVVPISAHALFARPLVVSPNSHIDISIESGPVVVSCDGRRTVEIATGGSISVTKHAQAVQFARIHATPFTERLVAKFELPVHGWRNA
ncbi:MAG: NAD kinase [Actinobacteria bacterium]|uniref:Unannotated protein n=1 Tax=freshwater metagenome TaxID=449393 RepID=A0A6J5YUE6_9ZZZZ|nr:NAD kinase [Actinomycetota bacterium]